MNDTPLTRGETKRRASERSANTRRAMKTLKPMGFTLEKDGRMASVGGLVSTRVDTQSPSIYESTPGRVFCRFLERAWADGVNHQQKVLREQLGISY